MKRNYKDIESICDNFQILYGSGISITESINLMQDMYLSKDYKESLKSIEKYILNGYSIDEALSKFKKLDPALCRSLMSIGENNGKLFKVLKALKRYYEKRNLVYKKFLQALSYPILVISVLMLFAIFISLFFLPSIYNIFLSMDKEVPKILLIIIKLRNYIFNKPIMFSIYFISYVLVLPYIFIKLIFAKVDYKKLFLKFKVFNKYYESLIILIFSIIVESEINLVQGIRECLENCEDKIIKRELKIISNSIEEGNEISNALKKCMFISKSTLSIIRISEKSGKLHESIVDLSEKLDRSFSLYVDNVLKKIQPVLLLLASSIVGIFIVVFIIPVFEGMY